MKTKSDGGSSAYYDVPDGARDVGDLIEYRKMSFGVGNIFKACYRLDTKHGTDKAYDLNKIIWFATRELEYLERQSPEAGSSPTKSHSTGPRDPEVSEASGPQKEG